MDKQGIPFAIKAGLAALALVWGVAACTEPIAETAENVDVEEFEDVNFSYDGLETRTFTINSTMTWSIRKSALDWLEVTPMNGGSNSQAVVTLKAKANDDLRREGRLTLSSASFTKTVTVSQDAMPFDPEIIVSGLEDNVIALKFSDDKPVTFTVWSNPAWTAEKKGLDWAEVSPLQGERKQSTEVTLTPTANTGDARQGTITFRAEGAKDVVITVSQTEYEEEPVLTVGGGESPLEFPTVPTAEDAVTLTVKTNRDWTVTKSEGLDWLSITPSEGVKNIEGTQVQVVASENSGNAREGVLTFSSKDGKATPVQVTVKQTAAFATPDKYEWTLSDAVLKATTWATNGEAKDDSGYSLMKWNVVNADAQYASPSARGPIVSSDGNGHYAYKGIWTDDNVEFTLAVRDLPAQSKVRMQFGFSGVKGAPAFWMVEYCDGGVWKPTSSSELTNVKGTKATATFVLTANNGVVNVDETATFTEAISGKGSIKFRIRCVDGRYAVNANDMSVAGKSATIRIRQYSDGTLGAIRFTFEK